MKIAALIIALALGLALGDATHAADTSTVLRLVTVKLTEAHPNDSTFVITENILIGGKKVGRDTLTCSSADRVTARCRIKFRLPSGTINARLTVAFSATKGKGQITGGTGVYAGARGMLSYVNLNEEGSRTGVVLTLA